MIDCYQGERFIRKETDRVKIKFICYKIGVGSFQRVKFYKAIKKMKNL